MTNITDAYNAGYTERAHAAILTVARDQHDLGGWIASVAADLGSTAALPAFVQDRGKSTSFSSSLRAQSAGTTVIPADYREP